MLVNLTSNEIVLCKKENNGEITKLLTLPPSETPFKADLVWVDDKIIDGIPSGRYIVKDVEGFPEKKENVYYIVNTVTKDCPSCVNRDDVLIASGEVPDDEGRTIGYTFFYRYTNS